MTRGAIVITGTDTEIGKTVFAAGLTAALGATYWKPVQAGLEGESDSETVARLSGCSVLPEAYRLPMPASPHRAAAAAGIEISPAKLRLPTLPGPLVIEGSGGLMVPLTRSTLYLDVIADWRLPVILTCRTALGTINHTLLSLEALRARGVSVLGLAFLGAENTDTQEILCHLGQTTSLGRLPRLAPLTPGRLRQAFAAIDLAPIRKALAC